ncbi:MAG: GntR family transcriptional regulator [Actinomycetota bacterium]
MTDKQDSRTTNATTSAYEQLKAAILSAELEPHQQFLERDLAERLDMSRTPVREACIRLQSEGLVEIVPRRGIRIVAISADDMAQLYDLLGVLEARAAELAATRATADQIQRLDDAVTGMHAAIDGGDLDAWARSDADFHLALAEASGNRHLVEAVIRSADLVHRARMVTLRLRPTPTASSTDHDDLVQAIRAGDAERAGAMHLAHRRASAKQLVGLLRHHHLTGL